jgi:BolA protein
MADYSDRIALIRNRLQILNPIKLDVQDDSALHLGHEGSKNGAGHYRVSIQATCFVGLSPLARHRLVYHYLQDLIPYPIHALALDAQTPK